jgi:signal transduction histidine kinase
MAEDLWEGSVRPERPPVEREMIIRSAWIVRLRWGAGMAVVIGAAVGEAVLGHSFQALSLAFGGALILAYNGVFTYLLDRLVRRRGAGLESFSRLASAQFITDWIALTVLAHMTGGVGSPLLPYFVFHAILVSILLPPRAAWAHAVVGILFVGVLGFLEAQGILPCQPLPGLTAIDYGSTFEVVVTFGAFASSVLVAKYLTGNIARPLWSRTWDLLQTQERLEDAARRTRTLYQIGGALTSDLDLDRVLDTLVRSTARALGGKACSLRLLDPDTGLLRLVAVTGLSDAYLAKGDVDPQQSPVDREVLAGKTVAVEDVVKGGLLQYPEEAVREGIRSVLCAPLTVRDRTIGVLRFYSADVRQFGPEDQDFLATLAGQGAVAIENARAYRHLEELEHAKSRFVFQVAHQLKSPLSAVRSALSLIEEGYQGEVSEGQRRLVDRAQKRAASLQTLVSDLMNLGALKDRVPERAKVSVRLDEVVARVVERIQPDVDARNQRLELDVPDAPMTVYGTPDDLEHVVGNLADNAVKYTPEGGTVRLRLRRDGSSVVLTCADTGIGIAPEAIPHLFEEFFRARNARELADGTGLGLSLVKRLVDLHRGKIEVSSHLGQGTEFTVTFPAA